MITRGPDVRDPDSDDSVDDLAAPTAPAAAPRGPVTVITADVDALGATTPLAALRADEVARTRVFLKVCLIIVAGATAAIQVAGGDPAAKIVLEVGGALVGVVVGWMLWTIRDPERYTARRVTIAAALVVIGGFGGVYYWGVASPACALILYGIYFFGFGGSRAATIAIYALCATLHAGLAAALTTGVLADRGLVRFTDLAVRDQIMTQVVVQFLYLCAFVTARISRRTTLAALSRLEQAVRAVAHREALLAEARAELDQALEVGGAGRYTDQVVGSFRLGLLIGRGGMGEVYEATAVADGTPAAVKLLHPSALADPRHVRRFLREAEAAAKLDCRNVVHVLEIGTTAGEVPYLAMERLHGFDLAHHLRRQRRLAPAQVIPLVRQIGAALEAARRAGIVHRDVKPHNLFLAEQGGLPVWKILDFGVSKLASNAGTLTRGNVIGTPGYMAPEQARGAEVDWRADLYALAAIAYRALTGHPPFAANDVPTTLYDVVYRMPTRPSQLAELGDDVDRVLAIGMAKDAAARFASGGELADALAAALRGELSDELRRRGDELAARHPWGKSLA